MAVTDNLIRERNVYKKVRKVPPGPDTISIGYEWEIPLSNRIWDNADWDNADFDPERDWYWAVECYSEYSSFLDYSQRDCIDYLLYNPWLNRHGCGHHFECGGIEIQSPVFSHLGSAKSHARRLIAAATDSPDVQTCGNTESHHMCGIHVHVRDDSPHPEKTQIQRLIVGMLNRSSSEDFVWDFSGRDDWEDYKNQARSYGWDSKTYALDLERQLQDAYLTRMCELNHQFDTLEFRLFGCSSDVLLPALDFAHSMYKFAREYLRSFRSNDTKRLENVDNIPYLWQWAEWVQKQSGYKELKKRANFNLISKGENDA